MKTFTFEQYSSVTGSQWFGLVGRTPVDYLAESLCARATRRTLNVPRYATRITIGLRKTPPKKGAYVCLEMLPDSEYDWPIYFRPGNRAARGFFITGIDRLITPYILRGYSYAELRKAS